MKFSFTQIKLIPFFLLLSLHYAFGQTGGNQDCATRKSVCGTTTLNDNNYGPGTEVDLDNKNSGCFSAGYPNYEMHSAWYSFKIDKGGTLTFQMSPTNGNDDYDFAIWKRDPSKPACPVVGAPLRCSVRCQAGTPASNTAWCGGSAESNVNTGLKLGESDVSESPSVGNGQCKELTVNPGEEYILLVNNSTPANNSGFTLSFGGSATLQPCPLLLSDKKITFNISAKQGDVEVHYTVLSDLVAKVTLEKSSNAIQFVDIQHWEINADKSDFSYYDYKPGTAMVYYRLNAFDQSGNLINSQISMLDMGERNAAIWPNPSSAGNRVFTINAIAENANFKVYDLVGHALKYSTISSKMQQTLEFENPLAPGIYFIRFSNAGNTQVLKLRIE